MINIAFQFPHINYAGPFYSFLSLKRAKSVSPNDASKEFVSLTPINERGGIIGTLLIIYTTHHFHHIYHQCLTKIPNVQ